MPKLRNAGTDIEKFAQWIGRKCRNHNPLEELGIRGGDVEKRGNTYKAQSKGDLAILADDPSSLVYAANGRMFKVTVEEVEPETYAKKKRIVVGY